MLTERSIETGVTAGWEIGVVAAREVGGVHSGRLIVCSARQLSKVGYAGGLEPHPATTNKMNMEISKRFIISIYVFLGSVNMMPYE
jgi:hypothetical protein